MINKIHILSLNGSHTECGKDILNILIGDISVISYEEFKNNKNLIHCYECEVNYNKH